MSSGLVPKTDGFHPPLEISIPMDYAAQRLSTERLEPSNVDMQRDWNFSKGNYELLYELASVKDNPKAFWQHVHNLKSKGGFVPRVTFDGKEYVGEGAATAFATFFSEVFLPNVPSLDPNARGCSGHNLVSNYVNITSITMEEVEIGIKRLKASCSVGPDNLPAYIVKGCVDYFKLPLLHLFNLALASGTYPRLWKISRVRPIPKAGDGTVVENHRPIAVLSTPAKLFEAIIHRALSAQVRPFLSDAQHGFRSKRSVDTNLLILVDIISEHLDRGIQVDVIYFDFKKAFDRVDNDVLMLKLEKIGFTPKLLSFFASYLRDRQQYVLRGESDCPELVAQLVRLYAPDIPKIRLRPRRRDLLAVPAARTVSRRNSPLLRVLTQLNALLASTPECDLLAWRWTAVRAECLRRQDQMTVEAGDAIILIDKRPELRYWKGQNQRTLEVGLFPSNILKASNPKSAQVKKKSETLSPMRKIQTPTSPVSADDSTVVLRKRRTIESAQPISTRAGNGGSKQFSYNKLVNDRTLAMRRMEREHSKSIKYSTPDKAGGSVVREDRLIDLDLPPSTRLSAPPKNLSLQKTYLFWTNLSMFRNSVNQEADWGEPNGEPLEETGGTSQTSQITGSDAKEIQSADENNSEVPEPETNEEKTEVIDPDVLLILGDPAEEINKFGPEINENIASRWTPILKKGLGKEEKDTITKQYQVPSNCTLLQSPKLNPEINSAISDAAKNRDKKLESTQQQLGVGLTALGRAMTLAITDYDKEKMTVIKHMNNAARILTDLHFNETRGRKLLITPTLDKNFLELVKDVGHDEYLYGKNLSENKDSQVH
ncbi:hypothetical protein MSG28_003315 [Choristoneura fumiferana]|uniref:Uncharacterized protein n=1 Tax=Choristoneura fumiferana TaxID=7141 RepID=A0ACC0KED2_CHOFU|nr:hypothetical protein MSG28_003315 [Choristoneura fumiferana]